MFKYLKFYISLLTILTFSSAWASQKFIIVSPPKCGAELLVKTVELLTEKKPYLHLSETESEEHFHQILDTVEKNNEFLVIPELSANTSYLSNILMERDYKVLFIIRDARDLTISMVYWIEDGNDPRVPIHGLSFDQQLMELITGDEFGLSATRWAFSGRMPWLQFDPNFMHVVRFEDLVGPEGGGNIQKQRDEIQNIAHHIELKITKGELTNLANQLFSKTYSDQIVKAAQWKTCFNKDHKIAYKRRFSHFLINIGYEKDSFW